MTPRICLYLITCLHVFVHFYDVRCDIRVKTMLGSSLLPFCFVDSSCYGYVNCIYFRILVSNTISVSDDVHVV
jgi:hypothetical protein